MSEVEFLPRWYVRRQRRRLHLRVLIYSAVLVAVFIGVALVAI